MIRTDFPHKIREVEHLLIPMPDGALLAARMWLPEDAEQRPVPALFELIPYRKSDGTTIRDAMRQPYYAGHGYAVVRVDIRGSGESDGILTDEYTPQEHADALACIAWMAEQPWCDGNVGMMGISWGGFNSLQVAALRPPALKAILAIGFTDDRYADDVHYMGGCVLASQMLSWSAVMFAYNAAPPDPRLVGERWREMWLERMDHGAPWIETWLSHQRRDAYWKHGSVGEDYGAIRVPVYAVGGWADSYNNSVPRLLAGLDVPRKGLIGPWVHTFPERGDDPGPAIGFLQDSLRWWDHWLKGIDTGIMDEPMLRTWIQDSVPPQRRYDIRPGRWVADPSWPSPNVAEQRLYLNSDGAALSLGEVSRPRQTHDYRGRLGHTFDAGQWGAYGYPGELAGDQRALAGEGLTFTGPAVTQPIDILGNPLVDLTLRVDRPLALVAVRLCDVGPDGATTLVSYGLLNLTHRDSHESPSPLEPGREYRITVQLNICGHRLAVGHRWQVSISPTYSRHAWPSPELVTLTLACGEGSLLRLPVRAPQPADEQLPDFPPAETSAPPATVQLRAGRNEVIARHDWVSNLNELKLVYDEGRLRYVESGMEVDDYLEEVHSVRDDDLLSMAIEIRRTLQFCREAWRVRIQADCRMTADATHFHLWHRLEGFESDLRVFSKVWTKAIPRDMV